MHKGPTPQTHDAIDGAVRDAIMNTFRHAVAEIKNPTVKTEILRLLLDAENESLCPADLMESPDGIMKEDLSGYIETIERLDDPMKRCWFAVVLLWTDAKRRKVYPQKAGQGISSQEQARNFVIKTVKDFATVLDAAGIEEYLGLPLRSRVLVHYKDGRERVVILQQPSRETEHGPVFIDFKDGDSFPGVALHLTLPKDFPKSDLDELDPRSRRRLERIAIGVCNGPKLSQKADAPSFGCLTDAGGADDEFTLEPDVFTLTHHMHEIIELAGHPIPDPKSKYRITKFLKAQANIFDNEWGALEELAGFISWQKDAIIEAVRAIGSPVQRMRTAQMIVWAVKFDEYQNDPTYRETKASESARRFLEETVQGMARAIAKNGMSAYFGDVTETKAQEPAEAAMA